MRFIQNTLLVIGAAALGTVPGFWCLAFPFSLIESKEGRGFGSFMIGYGCGAPLGAILGFVGAVCWITRGQSRDTSWSVATWTGYVLGLIVGLVAARHWGLTRQWWAMAVVAAAAGTLGGIVATTTVGIWKRVNNNAARPLGPESKKKRRSADREAGPDI